MKAVLISMGFLLTTTACTQKRPAELWLELGITRSFHTPIAFRVIKESGTFYIEEGADNDTGGRRILFGQKRTLTDGEVAKMQSIL